MRDGLHVAFAREGNAIGVWTPGSTHVKWAYIKMLPGSLQSIPGTNLLSFAKRDGSRLRVFTFDPNSMQHEKTLEFDNAVAVDWINRQSLISWRRSMPESAGPQPVLNLLEMNKVRMMDECADLWRKCAVNVRPISGSQLLLISTIDSSSAHSSRVQEKEIPDEHMMPSKDEFVVRNDLSIPEIELAVVEFQRCQVITRVRVRGNRCGMACGGRYLVLSAEPALEVRELPSLSVLRSIQIPSTPTAGPVLTADGRFVAFCIFNKQTRIEHLMLWDTGKSEIHVLDSRYYRPIQRGPHQPANWYINSASFFSYLGFIPNRNVLIAVTYDGDCSSWDVSQRRRLDHLRLIDPGEIAHISKKMFRRRTERTEEDAPQR